VEFLNRVMVPGHVLIRHMDGESVLLNLETEKYFGLDAMGTRMWEQVTTARSIDAAFASLLDEFDVEPATLREHLSELLNRLVENGLLTVLPSDVGTTQAI
jgi:hypothetical protein